MKKALRYLSYLSLVIGLSLLGVVFFYYMVALTVSLGILSTNYALYNFIKESMGFNFQEIYGNLFFMIFSLGSLGAILTYIGSDTIPRIVKEYM